jgi:hypothetical protein
MSTEKKLIYAVCSLFVIYGSLSIFWGEKIPAGGGLGFDGVVYGNAAKNFYHIIINKRIHSLNLLRIFPSGVIYCCFKILRIDRTNANIIKAFSIYNFILILLSIYLWFKITEKFKFPDRLVFMGLISFLFSYGIMKFNFYYPVITDTTAFFLGFLTLWGYMNKKNMLVLMCALVGSFTWPTVIYTVPLLQIFRHDESFPAIHNFRIRYLFIAALIVTLVCAALYAHYFSSLGVLYGVEVYEWLLPFGIVCFSAYMFFAFNHITNFDIKGFICNIHKRLNYRCLLIYGGIITFLTLLSKLYPRPFDAVTFNSYIGWISLATVAKPLYSLISHIVYYGPIVLLATFFWKKISLNVQKFGIGLICFFAFYLLQSIDPESRHLMFFFPFFITFTLLSLKEYAVSNLFLMIYFCLALGFSKCWFMINSEEFVQSINTIDSYNFKAIYSPVLQRYSMSFGLYMSFFSYIVQGAFVLLSGTILFIIYFKNNKPCRNSL